MARSHPLSTHCTELYTYISNIFANQRRRRLCYYHMFICSCIHLFISSCSFVHFVSFEFCERKIYVWKLFYAHACPLTHTQREHPNQPASKKSRAKIWKKFHLKWFKVHLLNRTTPHMLDFGSLLIKRFKDLQTTTQAENTPCFGAWCTCVLCRCEYTNCPCRSKHPLLLWRVCAQQAVFMIRL